MPPQATPPPLAAGPSGQVGALPTDLVVLIVAVAAGVVAQGGYYRPGRLLLTALVCAAPIVALARAALGRAGHAPGPARTGSYGVVAPPSADRRWPTPVRLLAPACAALAGWALTRAAVTGEYPVALGYLATLGTVAVAVPLVVRAGPAARERLAEALIAIGAGVAVTSWVGVAWRLPRFAVPVEHRLWRGGSTLTYPNAAAALLAMLALLGLALLVGRPRSVPLGAAGYLMVVGVGAALSRAGLLALLAGYLVLVLAAGVRRTLARTSPALLGAAVAVAALAPSFPVGWPPRPTLAVAGLLAGAAVALGVPRLPARIRPAALAGSLSLVAAAVVGRLGSGPVAAVLASRGTAASSGRSGAAGAALDLVARYPLAGTGPGLARFFWHSPDGRGAVALYAHDEYLQLLVDLGAIGAALLLVLIATIWSTARRAPAGRHRPLWAGAVAALVALAVHSGFDFLWHIAVLPLVGGLLVGIAGPARNGPSGRRRTGAARSGGVLGRTIRSRSGEGVQMNMSRSRLVALAAVAAGVATAAVAVPAGAAVSLQSESPPAATLNLGGKARLDANGAVVFTSVSLTCPRRAEGYLRVRVTQAVGNAIASGESDTVTVRCTGSEQRFSLSVSPTQRPFRKGVAFGRAVADVCPGPCETTVDEHNIQIVTK
ncbi:hypothetical protein GCM10027605_17970 [Micromonospora zhanjiangensis]